jgi:hypothetical protein
VVLYRYRDSIVVAVIVIVIVVTESAIYFVSTGTSKSGADAHPQVDEEKDDHQKMARRSLWPDRDLTGAGIINRDFTSNKFNIQPAVIP